MSLPTSLPSTDSRQFSFGPGLAWCSLVSYLDTGAAPSPIVPVRFDVTQSCTVDFAMTTKGLYGQNVFPTAIGIGQGKVTGKVKGARINSQLLATAFYGASNALTNGGNVMAIAEAHTVPGTPYVVTLVPPNSGVFVKNWGVQYAASGLYLTPVATSGAVTAVGEYYVNPATGAYTFDSGDSGAAVLIDYEYSLASTTGYVTFGLNSFLQGLITLFNFRYQTVFNSKYVGIYLPYAVGGKFTFDSKQQDFNVPEFDLEAFAGPSGIIADMYMSE